MFIKYCYWYGSIWFISTSSSRILTELIIISIKFPLEMKKFFWYRRSVCVEDDIFYFCHLVSLPTLVNLVLTKFANIHGKRDKKSYFLAPSARVLQVESGMMKSLFLLLLLVASGACDDVKFISKRNSGRMKPGSSLSVAPCWLLVPTRWKVQSFHCCRYRYG